MTIERRPRHGAEQRLEFIDFVSFWEGSINRSRLVEQFGISAQQASGDLGRYQVLAPDNLRYDLSSKRYVVTDAFQSLFKRPDADDYLGQLRALTSHLVRAEDTWLFDVPDSAFIPVPTRKVNAHILQCTLKAIRAKQRLDIQYQSLSSASDEALWRTITPHALATDGFRWHVRAFCHRDDTFKDFLLSRCRDCRDGDRSDVDASKDRDWESYFSVELIPNPRLSTSEKKAIELDYGMFNGMVVLNIRKALLYYFDKRFRSEFSLDGVTSEHDPKQNPVIMANLDAYREIVRGK
jgi:hypothetical protein